MEPSLQILLSGTLQCQNAAITFASLSVFILPVICDTQGCSALPSALDQVAGKVKLTYEAVPKLGRPAMAMFSLLPTNHNCVR